jgi:hypothetical protein
MAQQREGIFVGARPHGPEARHWDIERGDRASAPAQSQMRLAFGALHDQHHFFQKGAQKFFAIAVGGSGSVPHLTKISAERAEALQLPGADGSRLLLFPATEFRLRCREITKMFFPFCFQSASDESILGVHGAVASAASWWLRSCWTLSKVASTALFFTSLFRKSSTRGLLSKLEQVAVVRPIVEKRCLLLCQSNFSPLFVFIEIAGCTFILGAEGKRLGARSPNLHHLAPVADIGLLVISVGPVVLRLTLFAVSLFS